MQDFNQLIARIEKAKSVASSKLPQTEETSKIVKDADLLIQEITTEKFIKIPFVGDFSSGKSSLLNFFMDNNLLPTDINPLTAVSYELYYSADERLEVFVDNKKIQEAPLADIQSLVVKPGDVVRVYVNNNNIRRMNDHGIVLVDMPGLDSGIEAHNNAILNYISEGTAFILLVDSETATLKTTTISFVEEIKKYNIPVHVFVSKADKKNDEELASIQKSVEQTAKSLLGESAKVGITSAHNPVYGFNDVEALLMSLNSSFILFQRYSESVSSIENTVVGQLELQISFALNSGKNFEPILDELVSKKEDALTSLEIKNQQAQSIDGSVEDIMQDIKDALYSNSRRLATLAFSGNNKGVENELMSIIRPVLINSFKREMAEYQENISESIKDFSEAVSQVLNNQDNNASNVKIVGDLINKIGGKTVIENLVQKGMGALLKKVAGYKALTLLLKGLNPVIGILIGLVPDLLRLIFGKSKEQKIADLQAKIEVEIIEQVVSKLRPSVESMVSDTRQQAFDEAKAVIDEMVAKIDDNIKVIEQEKLADEQAIKSKVDELNSAIAEIKNS